MAFANKSYAGHGLGGGRVPQTWGVGSELEPQTKLHDARVMRTIQNQEATAGRICACGQRGHRRAAHTNSAARSTGAAGIGATERIELCVVEGVEGFPTELEGIALFEFETLEQ